jgi:hypothetical protein
MFGHQISPDCQERIMRFLSDPSYDSWDDIAHIIIAPDGCTVWQAISRLNPTFPAHGRSFDFEGKIIREWEEIPLPIDVVRAIKYCS